MTMSPERAVYEERLSAVHKAVLSEIQRHQLSEREFRGFVTRIDRGLQIARMQRGATLLDAG
jgi:hypothetical protein